MPTLTNILERASWLDSQDRDWLHQLVGDWQLLADLGFGDLELLISRETAEITHGQIDGETAEYPNEWMIAAHCRPATAATTISEDYVGQAALSSSHAVLRTACLQQRVIHEHSQGYDMKYCPVFRPMWGSSSSIPALSERAEKKLVGVLVVVRKPRQDRVPSLIRQDYDDIVSVLLEMVLNGQFPLDGTPTGYRHGTPRVTDGFLHIDIDGDVIYASPNAVSNFHRFGVSTVDKGDNLPELVTENIEDHSVIDESMAVVVMGRAPWLTEVESHGVTLSLRAVPLWAEGERLGAVILCRDITELRRRERELMTKDATIREINHRVKNNLQTVSALLRLQARRAKNEEAKQALLDAERRVATIALVHESLSQSGADVVNFDELFSPLLRMVSDVSSAGVAVDARVVGTFGNIQADQATTLSVVLNELMANAIEHGGPGDREIIITVERTNNHILLTVDDDGVGLSGGGPGTGLGTQIVSTLVASELRGRIDWSDRPGGGTRVTVEMTVR